MSDPHDRTLGTPPFTLAGGAARALPLLPWLPIPAALALVAVLAQGLRQIVGSSTWNSDVVTPMLFAESLPAAPPHTTAYMGNSAPYTTLWFDELTLHLPLHRTLWLLAPVALTVLGLLLLTWVAALTAGRWAAMLTLVIAAAAAPGVLFPLVAQAEHGVTDVNVIVLVALLVLAARWVEQGRSGRVLLVALPVAVITGADLASDTMLMVAGVGPFVAAPAVLWLCDHRRRWRRLTAIAVATSLLTVGVAALASLVADHQGLRLLRPPLTFAGPAQARDHLRVLGQLLLDMGDGMVFGRGLTVATAVAAVSGLLAAAAFVLTVVRVRRPAGSVRTPGGEPRPEPAVYVLYWAFVAVALAAAVVLDHTDIDAASIRYLVPAFLAMAAVVPVWAAVSPARRALVAIAVTLHVAVATQTLHDATVAVAFESPSNRHLPAVVAVLRAHRLSHGYAGYWDANSLTWQTDGRVASRAVLEGAACDSRDPGMLCAYRYNALGSWFVPRRGPTFLLVDDDDPDVHAPASAALGPPTAVYPVGRITVYVFPDDLAARWRAARPPRHSPVGAGVPDGGGGV